MAILLDYEKQLAEDFRKAMSEGSRFFEEKSAVQEALRRITERLSELGVEYAVAGGMALFAHGLRRFTEDVDILVSRDALREIHARLEGRGYRPPFPGSKNLRDTENGVRIEFLVAGQYPGDGKPKQVAFPEPGAVSEEHAGIRFLSLPALIELKLASGMSGADRLKDLADVQELIKLFSLPEDYAAQLNPYVQPRFRELWQATSAAGKRYLLILQGKPTADAIATLEQALPFLPDIAEQLRAMAADGVTLDTRRCDPPHGVYALVTEEAAVAARHGMHDESELL